MLRRPRATRGRRRLSIVVMVVMMVVVPVTADADPHARPADDHAPVVVMVVVMAPVAVMVVVVMRDVDLRHLYGLVRGGIVMGRPRGREIRRPQQRDGIRDRIEQI